VQSFAIEAVITKPRPSHHRGEVPVIETAARLGLRVLFASDRQSLDALIGTTPVNSRVAVLIDFGIIVSQTVLDYFPLGIVNSHFSLLPKLRGADPITFAILEGHRETGVSLMLIVPRMDEGPLLAQQSLPLSDTITAPELTEALIAISHHLLEANLPAYVGGELKPIPQDAAITPTYSRRLTKEDGYIDWSKPAVQLQREIRAYLEWPKSRAAFGPLEVVVTQAHRVAVSSTPGVTALYEKKPLVYCGEHALIIDRLKPAGKQEMTGEAFLAGYKKLFLDN